MTGIPSELLEEFPDAAEFIKIAYKVAWIARVADQSNRWEVAESLLRSPDIRGKLNACMPWLDAPDRILNQTTPSAFVPQYARHVRDEASHIELFLRELAAAREANSPRRIAVSDEITTRDLSFVESGGDAGITFELQCPTCKETIRLAMSGWWNPTCSCGVSWSLDIRAVGTPDD